MSFCKQERWREVTLSKAVGSVVFGWVDKVVLAGAKHAIACHLDPQINNLSTLGLLEQCVLDPSVVSLYSKFRDVL
jgi:hypothetical protein